MQMAKEGSLFSGNYASCFTTALLLLYYCFTAGAQVAKEGSLFSGNYVPHALHLLYYCFTPALLLLYCCRAGGEERQLVFWQLRALGVHYGHQ
jgi:hypothetical protein